MNTTEQRLQVLERELRRSRRVNRILILAVLAVASFAGARGNMPDEPQPPQRSTSSESSDARLSDVGRPPGGDRLRTVEADQFVLLDPLGRSRVRMQVTDDGPAISMFDEEGRKRVELSQTNTASGLRLFDSGQPVVSLQLRPNGDAARLEITSEQGSALMKSDGFSVHDAAHDGRLHLSLLNGNFPVLGISQSGQQGPSTIELTAGEGSRSLKMHDADGFPLFSVFATDNGDATLDMRHPTHERSFQICTGSQNSDGPTMAFFAPAKEDGTGGILPRVRIGFENDRQPHIRIMDRHGQTLFAAPPE